MAINDVLMRALAYVEPLIQFPDGNGRAIGIGAHELSIRRRLIRKYGVDTIDDESLRRHFYNVGVDRNHSSKQLARALFRHFGYSEYVDLDTYDRADLIADLSKPIPADLRGKFDFVYDPTSNYVTDPLMAFANTSQMLRVGGVKLVMSNCGDQLNRFELNPSPNFLIDYHTNNGFEVLEAFLIGSTGRIRPYRRYRTKGTPLVRMLPLRNLVTYAMLSLLREMIIHRPAMRRIPYVEYRRKIPQSPRPDITSEGDNRDAKDTRHSKPGWRQALKDGLPAPWASYLRRKKLGWIRHREKFLQMTSVDWVVIVILRKTAESDFQRLHITAHYRDLDQTSPSDAGFGGRESARTERLGSMDS